MPRKDPTDRKISNFEKRFGLPNTARKLKMTKRVVTVDDILARSDVNATLADFEKCKADVTELVIVYKKANGELRIAQSGIPKKDIYWMLIKSARELGNSIIYDDDED